MESRRLGKSEVVLPPIVYGAWAIGGWWWGGTDDPGAINAMKAAAHGGMMAIDTAPIYGFGHSESLVGEALESHRSSVLLLTKCGLSWTREDGPVAFPTKTPSGKKVLVRNDLRPESIRQECEDSLRRLRTDVIDLYQCHWPDPETPIEDTMGALARLREEGKIRAIGVSNFDTELLEKARCALGEVPLASTQPRYSLLARQIEKSILPWCQTHEVGVLAYRPIEQGLLAGAVPPERQFPPGDMRPTQKIFSP
ncbi:MAG: aldo/keto reductase, partial [Myxococcota bacterium]|nr:aldo/keto reductase [Myxococcota bacterium]